MQSAQTVSALSCPICDGGTRRLFQIHGYHIHGCQSCSHQIAECAPAPDHLNRVYGDHYFEGGGAGYSDYLSEADILRAHGRNYARLMGRFMKPASVLDVGAAAGFVLKGFIDSGWTGKGIEPNARMAGFARTELGLNVDLAPLESYSGAERFNLIVMIQVVAHFFDVRRAFEAAAGLTRPNGFWLIETWDRKSWTARILGKHWYEYSPPSVLRWFTPDDLKRLAKQFGFEEVARGHPVKRISGAHAKSLLQYKLSKHWLGSVTVRAMEIIPNRLVLPHPSEDLFWMLLQKRGGA